MARILVIDDSRVQRTFARLVCEEAGYEVVEAEDGNSGIQQAVAGNQYSLILLDLQLPDMSGQQVLRKLAEHQSGTPVIVITADDAAPIEQECLALGAARAVRKPEDPSELVSLINAVVAEADAPPLRDERSD